MSISADDFDNLRASLFTKDGMENAVFGLCGFARDNQHMRILVRKLIPVPDQSYAIRTGYHLEIVPSFINSVIDSSEGKFPIVMIHSHPGALSPEYSSSDNEGESRLFKVYSDLLPELPHVSLLFSDKRVIGRFWSKDRFESVDEINVVGRRFPGIRFGSSRSNPDKKDAPIFDRQILAFGDEVQSYVGDVKIGIVGLGGTGSSVAEQLVRMGSLDMLLVDNDNFEPSNITRTYGTKRSDVSKRQAKTKIAARNLKSINPNVSVKEVRSSVVYQETLMELKSRDVIFCCTDNDLSRSVLNRLAYQYLVPTIDMGVRIVAKDAKVEAAAGRVSLIGPGLACLRCSHHLDPERIRVESLDPRERDRLLKEKYIEGTEASAPAVISLTSTVSSLAVTMFLGMLTEFSTVPSMAPEQIYDAVEGIVFKSRPERDPLCRVCGPHGVKGLGDTQIISAYSVKDTLRAHARLR